MNWEAIGAIGEVAGAVGVVVTLAFLARQIGQNTRALRANTNRSLNEQQSVIRLRLATDTAAFDLLMRGLSDFGQLESLEGARYTLMLRAVLQTFEDSYVQFQEGSADRDTWEAARSGLEEVVTAPSFKDWWTRNNGSCKPSFQSEVNRLLGAATQPDSGQ